jgi:hypothetical protein
MLTRLTTLSLAQKQKHATLQFVASAYIHSCVAFLPCARLVLKALKPKEPAPEPQCLGEHIKRRRLGSKLTQRQVAEWIGPS